MTQPIPSDRVLGAVFLFVGISYVGAAVLISEPEGQYAVIGPRLFPLVVGVGLVVCSLWIAIQPKDGPALPAIDWLGMLATAFAFLIYVVVLGRVGFLVATTIFITVESRLLGSRAWRRDVIVGLGITLSVYLLFSVVLGIRLPSGFFG
jgi:putative tricarboxylic transport membrane protein